MIPTQDHKSGMRSSLGSGDGTDEATMREGENSSLSSAGKTMLTSPGHTDEKGRVSGPPPEIVLLGQSVSSNKRVVPPEGSTKKMQRMTTREIQRESERVSRNENVKKRIGPIVSRLKASLSKIESIETAMDSFNAVVPGMDDAVSPSSSDSNRQQRFPARKSRDLMHESMDLVKRKLLRLRRMEEMLATSEDRRHDLQHFLFQVSLSKPILELAAMKQQNNLLQKRLDNSVNEKKVSIETLSLDTDNIDEVLNEVLNDALSGEHRDSVQLEENLKQTNEECNKSKSNSQQWQATEQDQAMAYDDLECRVEHLKTLCEDLLKNLKKQEDRNACLEQELLETRQLSRKEHPRTRNMLTQGDKENSATELNTSSLTESTDVDDEVGFDTSFSIESVDCSATSVGDTDEVRDCIRQKLQARSQMSNADTHLVEDQTSVIERLMATIGSLDRENAELREGKHLAVEKYEAVREEMKVQARSIQNLQRRLASVVSSVIEASGEVEFTEQKEQKKEGAKKASFFQRLLKNSNSDCEA